VLVLSAAAYFTYTTFFQFNQQDIKDYINEEAAKYDTDKNPAVYKIIKDGVEHILSETNLRQQVMQAAKMNGTTPEQELVHAAVMYSKAFGYIN
jgi:hypothetical protein